MKPQEIAKLALRYFTDLQSKEVSGVVIEEVEAPEASMKYWRVTIGFSPYQTLLGVPVSGPRLRSVIRINPEGEFLGMHLHKDSA